MKLDSLERYRELLKMQQSLEKSGNPESLGGPSHWQSWDEVTRAALTENCIGVDDISRLRRKLESTDPVLRECIRKAYKAFEQPIRAEAARIMKLRAAAMLSELEREARELDALIQSLRNEGGASE